MSEKPLNDVTENIEAHSQLPDARDQDLDIKVAAIIQALGITQNTEEEFLNTLEAELVSAVDESAGLAIRAHQLTAVQSRLQQDVAKKLDPLSSDITREKNPSLNQAELKEQEFIEKKLELYKKTQDNIKEEIDRLIAISGSKNISPENALHINQLIAHMRSLDKRIEFYTKKDQMLRQKQKEREQLMIQTNQKKKLAEKIKQDKKSLEKARAELGKRNLAFFFLPGKWLEVYRNNQKNMIAEKEKDIAKSEAQLKTLEKQGEKLGTQTARLPAPSSTRAAPPQALSVATNIQQPLDQQRIRDIPSATVTTTQIAQARSTRLEQTAPVSGTNPKYIPSKAIPRSILRTPQPQRKEPFAELFANPTIKGTASRSPDSQSGKIMREAEENRNVRVAKEAANLRTAAQKTETQTPKK